MNATHSMALTLVLALGAPALGQPDAPKAAEQPAAQPEKPKTPAPPPQPTLDDLLGIKPKPAPKADPVKPDAPVAPPTPPAAPDQNKTDLDRLLTAAEMGDALKQAITLMGDASSRLNEHKDAGIQTQRVQEDVIRRLDQLISSMEKQKQQQQGQGQPQPPDPSGKQQPPKQGQQQKGQQQQQPSESQQGDGMQDGQRPSLKEGALKPELESARAAWGSLPQRVRDMLMQGAEDRFSARYKALTQEYYKRLAEENSK